MCDIKGRTSSGITSEKTECLKAVALILLMIHHLFGCDFLQDWISPFKGADIVFGVSGRICLAMFLFCSGYGLYKSYVIKENPPKHYIPQKIVKTLIPYWVVMLIAVMILLYLGKFDPVYIPANLFAWIHEDSILYVSFSWYIKLHLLILLTLPLIRLIEKKWRKNILVDSLMYIILPFLIWFFLKGFQNEEVFTNIFTSLISSLLFLLSWYSFFGIGMIFAKYNVYDKIHAFSERFPKPVIILLSLILCGYALFMKYLVYHFYSPAYYFSITDCICMPLFVSGCLLITDNLKFKSRYVIPYLGKRSIFYWLLSGMFFLNTSELMPLITWPKVSILMLIWLFVILTPFVFCCDKVSGLITGLIFRKKKD